jgi:hypothetical protein
MTDGGAVLAAGFLPCQACSARVDAWAGRIGAAKPVAGYRLDLGQQATRQPRRPVHAA